MNNINEVGCVIGSGNQGLTPCSYTPGYGVGHILHPKGTSIPASALESRTTLIAFLKTKLQAVNWADRWFILGKWVGLEPQGQDLQTFSYADRSTIISGPRIEKGRYEHANGKCYHKQLQKFNGLFAGGYNAFEITVTGELMGTIVPDATTGLDSFIGWSMSLGYAEDATRATPTDPERYFMQIEWADINELNINSAMFKAGLSLLGALNILGVKDVTLVNTTPTGSAAGVFVVKTGISCGSKSLVEQFPALAASTYWDIQNAATNGPITATTIAVDTTDPAQIVFTLDTTDPDYPGAGGFIRLNIKGISVVLSVFGAYESDKLLIPRS